MISEKDKKSEERIDYFLGRITDENPGNRWKAIEALARTGDARAVGPIIAALSDVDWRVRQKAAWALGFLGDPAALGPLRHALRDESEGVRDIILEALDEIKRKMMEND
jgi:HEAT repeat protein